jgi:glutamine---fructose-6-phosphate transaminase (isomerizing)
MTHLFADIERQPQALCKILSAAVGENADAYRKAAELLRQHSCIYIVGMGASWHAGMAAASYFHARKHVALLFDAAELLNYGDCDEGACALLLSRSGRSKELVDLACKLHGKNIPIISITNDSQSPMALKSDCVIDIEVPFDTNVSVTMYSGIALAGCLLAAMACDEEIGPICTMLKGALASARQRIPEWARQLDASDWLAVDVPYYFLARGASMASGTEARLLWEEAAKNPATALTTGGFRHGPQEIVREGLRVAMWLDRKHLESQDLMLAADLRAEGANVLLIGQRAEPSTEIPLLELPPVTAEWQFVIEIIPIQIAAERLAVLGGRDCDSFRLCSYVVTDEGGLTQEDRASVGELR